MPTEGQSKSAVVSGELRVEWIASDRMVRQMGEGRERVEDGDEDTAERLLRCVRALE